MLGGGHFGEIDYDYDGGRTDARAHYDARRDQPFYVRRDCPHQAANGEDGSHGDRDWLAAETVRQNSPATNSENRSGQEGADDYALDEGRELKFRRDEKQSNTDDSNVVTKH